MLLGAGKTEQRPWDEPEEASLDEDEELADYGRAAGADMRGSGLRRAPPAPRSRAARQGGPSTPSPACDSTPSKAAAAPAKPVARQRRACSQAKAATKKAVSKAKPLQRKPQKGRQDGKETVEENGETRRKKDGEEGRQESEGEEVGHAVIIRSRCGILHIATVLLPSEGSTWARNVGRMSDSPLALLRAHARHAPWNARGLAAHVTALVDSAGVRPTNASARAAPSARAVRFYVANSLMDRPDGVGTSATYNYRHFLQLLSIKLRQREGSTLDGIKKEMKDTTGDALERRVAQSLAPVLLTGRPGAAELDDESPSSWRRVQVAEGIELHLRADSPAARDDTVVALREAMRATLGRSDA